MWEKAEMLDLNSQIKTSTNWIQKEEHPKASTTARVLVSWNLREWIAIMFHNTQVCKTESCWHLKMHLDTCMKPLASIFGGAGELVLAAWSCNSAVQILSPLVFNLVPPRMLPMLWKADVLIKQFYGLWTNNTSIPIPAFTDIITIVCTN